MKTVLTLGAALLLGACVTSTEMPATSNGAPATTTATTVDVSTAGIDGLLARQRINARLPALRPTAQLNAAAQAYAQDMVTRDYFSHQSPTGQKMSDRLRAAGIGSCAAAENISFGYDNVETVMSKWMESAAHRANILDGRMSLYGLGRANDKWVLLMIEPC